MLEENTTREFWVQRPGSGEIVSGRLKEIGSDDVVVRTTYSGISRGTEALVFRGEVPISSYQAMRAPFQEGAFPAPVKFGYISVGVVESAGDAVSSLVGKDVFCLYPHQDRYVVPASAVTLLPPEVPAGRAVLAANMETALNAVWDAKVALGDRVVVIGAGVLGLLVSWLIERIPETDVTVVDPNEKRASAAEQLGVRYSATIPYESDADVVVHASGSPEGLAAGLTAAGVEGRVIELSWFGHTPVSLPLGEAFHDRRLTIRSSQVGRIPPERAPRWNYARRMAVALNLLKDNALDALISAESEFEELPKVMERLALLGEDTLCHRIRYN